MAGLLGSSSTSLFASRPLSSPSPKSSAFSLSTSPDLTSIKEKLSQVEKDLEPNAWCQSCIYRVPWCMKVEEDYEKNYVPRLVSLGPYHYKKPELSAMEIHKYRALRCLLKRNKQNIDTYIKAIQGEVLQEARAYYEDLPEEFLSDDEKLVKMLVIDGCFILEILRFYTLASNQDTGYSKKDPVFSKTYMKDGILRDMILLENQIPFFVLEILHDLEPDHSRKVVELVISVYNPSWVTERSPTLDELSSLRKDFTGETRVPRNRNSRNRSGFLHCLHVFRETLTYSIPPSNDTSIAIKENEKNEATNKDIMEQIPSATKLKDAGVTFKSVKKSFPFWEVKFEDGNFICGGTLTIPQIVISDRSELMFLNLMAFEQSHLPPNQAQITSYIAFLDNLVNTSLDIAQLVENKIIIHTLGSDEEVANMFNRLGEGIYFSVEDGCHVDLYKALNEYSNKNINQWRAKLMRDYFNSPWSIIAFLGAALGLVLTGVQTFKG